MLNEVNSTSASLPRRNTADKEAVRTVDTPPQTIPQSNDTATSVEAVDKAQQTQNTSPDPVEPQESRERIEQAVSRISDFAQNLQRTLQFSIDEDAGGKTIIRVINSKTGELVRQIPSEEALELAEVLDKQTSNPATGLLLNTDV